MELLEKNEHPHPLILMRGFKFEDLNALVDNTYKGEVSISSAIFDNFLLLGKELGLKGMENAAKRPDFTDPLLCQGDKNPLGIKREAGDQEDVNCESLVDQARYLYCMKTKELDNAIKAMMEFSPNFVQSKNYEHKREKARICKVCGKEGRLFAIKRHIEAMHISGISHP